MVLLATVDVGGGNPVAFSNTHWTYSQSLQPTQAQEAINFVAQTVNGDDVPRIITGDLNIYQIAPQVSPAQRVMSGAAFAGVGVKGDYVDAWRDAAGASAPDLLTFSPNKGN